MRAAGGEPKDEDAWRSTRRSENVDSGGYRPEEARAPGEMVPEALPKAESSGTEFSGLTTSYGGERDEAVDDVEEEYEEE